MVKRKTKMDPHNPSQPSQTSPAPSSGSTVGSNLPYFLRDEPLLPQPKSNKKSMFFWIISGSVAILILVAGAITLTAKKPVTVRAAVPTQSLVTKDIDAITFAYPGSWQRIADTGSNFSLGFGDTSTTATASALIFYKKSQIMAATPASMISEADRKEISTTLADSTTTQNAQNDSCKGFVLGDHSSFSASSYFGVDISYSCAQNANNVASKEVDRYIYTGDGYLYQVAVVATNKYWQQYAGTLNTMVRRVVPHD